MYLIRYSLSAGGNSFSNSVQQRVYLLVPSPPRDLVWRTSPFRSDIFICRSPASPAPEWLHGFPSCDLSMIMTAS